MTGPSVRLIVDPPRPGAWNMAIDDALMASGRRGDITLRLYRWSPGCLSFGRHQTARNRYDGETAAELGYDVVRRPTGGRSVLHHRELTYSVTAPASWGSLRDVYLRINRALAAGLRPLATEATVNDDRPGTTPRPTCHGCQFDCHHSEATIIEIICLHEFEERSISLVKNHPHADHAGSESSRPGIRTGIIHVHEHTAISDKLPGALRRSVWVRGRGSDGERVMG